MRVLVTNDDGIDAVGIQRLAVALARDDRFEVLVVAPDRDQSGAAASLGVSWHAGVDTHRVELPDDPSIEAWALDGSPAMCVLAANLGGFGAPPELVVSGINAGLNTGRAVLHSGTVGAAFTAQNLRMSGVAVSLQTGDPWQWDTAAALAIEAIGMVLEGPRRSVLNLNVPDRERSAVLGIRWARLAPFGEVRMTLRDGPRPSNPSADPARRRLATEMQLAQVSFEPDTDTGLVRAGYATLTTLVAVAEAWPTDHPTAESAEPTEIQQSITPGAPLHAAHRIPDASARDGLRRPRTIADTEVARRSRPSEG